MKVVVTGAGGFIGSHLSAALQGRGHALAASLPGVDTLVHLANIAHARAADAELQRVNVDGTLKTARQAAAADVRRVVYLSSSLAADSGDRYGRSKAAAEVGPATLRGI